VNVFAVYEARWLGLDATPPVEERRWLLRGRAHVDVRVGDALSFGGRRVLVDSIRTYGRETDLLSKMMTGELTVRWDGDDAELYLTR